MPSRFYVLHRMKFNVPTPVAPSDEGAVGVSRLRERKSCVLYRKKDRRIRPKQPVIATTSDRCHWSWQSVSLLRQHWVPALHKGKRIATSLCSSQWQGILHCRVFYLLTLYKVWRPLRRPMAASSPKRGAKRARSVAVRQSEIFSAERCQNRRVIKKTFAAERCPF